MKLGPFTFGRTTAAAAKTVKAPADKGASGTMNFDGFLEQLEYNVDLTGENGLKNYERMRSSDGASVEALTHITAPIKNASWEIEPFSDDPEDLEIAEAVRRAFFVWPRQAFSEFLDQALDYLVFGHQVFEQVWQVVDDELEFDDPNAPPELDETAGRARQPKIQVPSRQFLTFRRFKQLLPRTIYKWHMDDGELDGITQSTWKGGQLVQPRIDADQLIVLVNQRRGDDMTGRSLLRGAYKHWVLKEVVEKIEVIALERHGVGVWVAYPSQASVNDQEQLDRLEEILQNLRAGAQTYIVSPGPKAQAASLNQDGFLFELVSPTGTPPDFKAAKEYHRGEIKGSMLVRFSELGHGQTGARATGETQSKVWRDALHAVARHVGEVMDDPIRRFVQANYGVARYPRLVAQNIEATNLAEFAEANARLVAAGAVRDDRSYRAFVRKSIGAPPEDDPTDEPEPADPTHVLPDDQQIEEE